MNCGLSMWSMESRGQESLADCEFVEKMCGRLGVECKSHHIDVPKEAKQCGRTLEETARLMRYEIFEKKPKAGRGKDRSCP